jgi:large subunit ribosomal protein L9
MNLILTQDIDKLGQAGDVVKVKPGYGRNYLLPRGLAMLATDGRVNELAHKRRVVEDLVRKEVAGHELVAKQLAGVALDFEVKVGEEGKLFGSVTHSDIAARLAERSFTVDRRKIQLSEPIKQVGEYDVTVRLHREVSVQIKLNVFGDGEPVPAEPAPEEPPEEPEERAFSDDEAEE